MWAAQKDPLEQAGYDVTLPDLPGASADSTLSAWADRVLAATDKDLVPVGASMGGYLAFELWRRARERIRALVLAATRAGADTPDARKARDDNILVLDEEGVPALWERLEEKLFSPEPHADLVARAREIALEQGATRLTAALEAMRDREDSTALLREIDVPVLVVAGEQDALIPREEAETMVEALPRARLVTIPTAGHLVPLERPDEFNRALLSFLDELAA